MIHCDHEIENVKRKIMLIENQMKLCLDINVIFPDDNTLGNNDERKPKKSNSLRWEVTKLKQMEMFVVVPRIVGALRTMGKSLKKHN